MEELVRVQLVLTVGRLRLQTEDGAMCVEARGEKQEGGSVFGITTRIISVMPTDRRVMLLQGGMLQESSIVMPTYFNV